VLSCSIVEDDQALRVHQGADTLRCAHHELGVIDKTASKGTDRRARLPTPSLSLRKKVQNNDHEANECSAHKSVLVNRRHEHCPAAPHG
jgi:hypothetical protein